MKSVGDSSLLHSDFPARRPSNIQESLKFIVFENKKRIYGKLQKNFVFNLKFSLLLCHAIKELSPALLPISKSQVAASVLK